MAAKSLAKLQTWPISPTIGNTFTHRRVLSHPELD